MKICVDTFGVTIKVKVKNGNIWGGGGGMCRA